MSDDLPDGVYFGLQHDLYIALPRLGSGAISDLAISPATFWHRSWMNPRRREDATSKRDAKAIGTAAHMARLEPGRFRETYARGFDASAHPDALRTDAEVCAVLADMGQTQKAKGELAPERAMRLRSLGYDGEILSVLAAEHDAHLAGRIGLPPDIYDDIEASGEMMRGQPEIAECITGGEAEVTILWTMGGVGMRARIDYLKPGRWTDLKTFSNSMGKVIDQCVTDAFRFNRYFVQAVLYDMAIEAARSGSLSAMWPEGSEGTPETGAALLDALQRGAGPLECTYLFIESNGSGNILRRDIRLRAPVRGAEVQAAGAEIVADYMTQPSRLMRKGVLEIESALRRFRWAMEVFGPDAPWGPVAPVGTIGDDDYHDSFLDGDGR